MENFKLKQVVKLSVMFHKTSFLKQYTVHIVDCSMNKNQYHILLRSLEDWGRCETKKRKKKTSFVLFPLIEILLCHLVSNT